jgi:hypothetical protein
MAMRRARRPRWQKYDEVAITTVPRYKESFASGSEWRISATLQFKLKGVVLAEEIFATVDQALLHAASLGDNSEYKEEPSRLECDQEGCSAPATITYKLKNQYTGHCWCKSDPYQFDKTPLVRKFCDRHKRRGDCGLEDADENYELIDELLAVPPPDAPVLTWMLPAGSILVEKTPGVEITASDESKELAASLLREAERVKEHDA